MGGCRGRWDERRVPRAASVLNGQARGSTEGWGSVRRGTARKGVGGGGGGQKTNASLQGNGYE